MRMMTHEATEYYASRAPRRPSGMVRGLRAVLRIILPVVALMAVLVWADAEKGAPATFLDSFFPADRSDLLPGYWLTYGHLVLGLMFLVLNLTNRRYGAAYAMAQVAVVWVIVGALAYVYFVHSDQPLPASPVPPMRTSFAFVVAVLAAQILNISVFEWTRGRPWWRAPLYASLWGSALFCLIFFPAAYYEVGIPWTNQMIVYFGILAVMAVLLLVPYYLLRSLIRPLPGFGGA